MRPEKRINEAVIYEAYFDLWGFRPGWIDTIGDKLMDFASVAEGDECELYRCEACMALRFRSQDKARVEMAKRIFLQFARLANPACIGEPEEVVYHSV